MMQNQTSLYKITQGQDQIMLEEEERPKSFAISPNDQNLAIILDMNNLDLPLYLRNLPFIVKVFNINTNNMHIITLQQKNNLLSHQLPQMRYTNDSKILYIGNKDKVFYIKNNKQLQTSFNSINHPIQDILELKNKIFLIITQKNLKIIQRNKIIRKFILDQRLIKFVILDYDQENDLILIEMQQSLRVICPFTLYTYCNQPVSFLKQAKFLSNHIITLKENNSTLKKWEIDYQSKGLKLMKQMGQDYLIKFEPITTFQINVQRNFIILVCRKHIVLLDDNLKFNQIISTINMSKSILSVQQISKSKIIYLDSKEKKVIKLDFTS